MESDTKVFKRKIYDAMLKWKQERDGKTALLIKGARRVGKSTIAEEFARNEYESYIVVDFADAPDELWAAVDHISDRNYFFTQLQFIYNLKSADNFSMVYFCRPLRHVCLFLAIKACNPTGHKPVPPYPVRSRGLD